MSKKENEYQPIQLPKLSTTRSPNTNNPFSMPKDIDMYKSKVSERELTRR